MKVYVKGGGATLDTVTANAAQVLSGYTYNDSDGEVQTGTMNNKGVVTGSVDVDGTYTNVAGYYSSLSITGPTLSGNAAADHVLDGKTFYKNSGTKRTGTMTNWGAVTCTIGVDDSYSGAAGYYSSISVTGPTLSGTAAADHVLDGKTFYKNSGTKRTGTMTNWGALNATYNNWNGASAYSNTNAGYYSSIKVNIAWTAYKKSIAINDSFINTAVTAAGSYGVSYSMGTATSVKIFASGGYIWITRNAGSDGTAYITKIW